MLSTSSDIAVTDLQQAIQNAMVAITDHEQVKLADGLNRIVDRDVIAKLDVPSFDNAAMDGFAFCVDDLAQHAELVVVGQSYAGNPFVGQLEAGQAIRITTGAPMPERADCVLPHELAAMSSATTLGTKNIVIKPGQNRRLRGEDLAVGSTAIHQGKRLTAADLGVLASLGHSTIAVRRKLKIAIFSTGDELRNVGQSLENGGIYDSNRVTLHALLRQCGAEVVDLGALGDNQNAIETALRRGEPQVDAIITSGGISAGSADFTKTVMQRLGHVQFWSVNMRPGRPFAFGTLPKSQAGAATYLFGLPGNPVAMLVSFYLFVRPALQLLSGTQISAPPEIDAMAAHPIDKKIGRSEFQRGIFKCNAQGQLEVGLTGEQGSGMLSSMTRANCLVVLKPEQGNIATGDTVKIIIFEGLQY